MAIPRATHRSVISPDDTLFSQTVSPLKPNYKALCQSIQQTGVPTKATSSAPAARFVRRVSPQPVAEGDLFKNTLSPFKCEDYEAIRGQINTGKIDFGSSPLMKKVPTRPVCAPPPRDSTGADGPDAARPFRRGFSGRDISNVVSPVHEPAPAAAAVMKSAMSPSRQAPPSRVREASERQQQQHNADKENDVANSSIESSSGSGGSGGRGFHRGRTLKPAPVQPNAESCDSPFHVIEQFEASLQPKKPPVRPQVPPRRGPARVRVTSLVCCYSRRHGSSRKKKASRHGRRGGSDRLESIPEEHLALFGGYPEWLESVCSSEMY